MLDNQRDRAFEKLQQARLRWKEGRRTRRDLRALEMAEQEYEELCLQKMAAIRNEDRMQVQRDCYHNEKRKRLKQWRWACRFGNHAWISAGATGHTCSACDKTAPYRIVHS